MATSDSAGMQSPHLILLSHPDPEIRNLAWYEWLANGNEQKIRKAIQWYSRRYHLNEDDEEDIFSDTIIVLMKKLAENKYDPNRASLTTYASGIAEKVTKKKAELEARAGVNYDDIQTQEDGVEIFDKTALSIEDEFERNATQESDLKKVRGSMKSKEWQAIVLTSAYELSGEEAAEVMNVTHNYLRQLVHRGKQSARRMFTAD